MALSKHCKVGLFAALSLSMLTMLLAKQDFNASQKVTLNPKTIAELKAVTMTLDQIGGDNKVLGAVVSPVQSLCQLCLGGSLPGLVGLLQAIVAALLALISAILAPLLGALLGTLDPALGRLLAGCVPSLLSCILLETSYLVQGLLSVIVGLLCFIIQLLF